MAVKKATQEQAVYVLDFPDVVEALSQYIEAQQQEKIPRHPKAAVNFNPETNKISLIIPLTGSNLIDVGLPNGTFH